MGTPQSIKVFGTKEWEIYEFEAFSTMVERESKLELNGEEDPLLYPSPISGRWAQKSCQSVLPIMDRYYRPLYYRRGTE